VIGNFDPIACPWCGTVNDGHENSVGASPKPGDISICWKCKSFARFTKDGQEKLDAQEAARILGPKEMEAATIAISVADTGFEALEIMKELNVEDDQDDRELGIRSPAWGDVFNIPAGQAFFTLDGVDITPPMNVDVPIEMLGVLVQKVLRFMVEMGDEAYDTVVAKMDEDIVGEYQKAIFKSTAVLVALGYGKKGVTVESMLIEAIKKTVNEEGEDAPEEILELMRLLEEDNDEVEGTT
jgi:hypothetical protein